MSALPPLDDLLYRSMQAHQAARRERFEAKRKQLLLPDPQPLLVKAYRLRLDAIAFNPGHRHPAWKRERTRMGSRTIHEDLMSFYGRHLSGADTDPCEGDEGANGASAG